MVARFRSLRPLEGSSRERGFLPSAERSPVESARGPVDGSIMFS